MRMGRAEMIYGLALAAIVLAISGAGIGGYVKGQKKVQAKWDLSVLQAKDAAHELERMNRISKDKAIENRTKDIMANMAAADRARAAADGLRSESQRSLQSARDTHAACVVSANAHAELLNFCQQEYRDMAKNADGHAADSKALIEAWPK